MGDLFGTGYDLNGPRPRRPLTKKDLAEFDAWFAEFRARMAARRAPPQPEKHV